MDAAGNLTTDPNSALPRDADHRDRPRCHPRRVRPAPDCQDPGWRAEGGDWLEETRIFPVIEEEGEISSYDDFSNNGRTGINFNYPQFQSYLYQTFVDYGERETERAGLMRINYVGELTGAASGLLNRFGNLGYAFGISRAAELWNLINNPYLSAYLSPAIKAWGGTSHGSTPAPRPRPRMRSTTTSWRWSSRSSAKPTAPSRWIRR